MTFRFRHIWTRFAALLAFAAVLPLVAYGVASVYSLQRGTRETVVAGNLNVATRAAEEIRRYVSTNATLLKALAADLQNTGLEQWQQDRILKNYILQFGEFREVTLFDAHNVAVASSRIRGPRVTIPGRAPVVFDGVGMSAMQVDQDLLPTAVFSVRLHWLNQDAGWLVGEISLEEMWRMVDRIRIGRNGYALVVGNEGQLIAHGDPDRKSLVASTQNMAGHPLLAPDGPRGAGWREYTDDAGRRQLGAAARIPQLGWAVIVEQPVGEAYATAARLRTQLAGAIVIALIVTIAVGYFFGRSFITPILRLQRATQAVAAGHLDARVDIGTSDEFAQLGDAFNTMANRLVELQEDVKRQERQATIGRIASGLVHDLSHPIQNIGNSARLMLHDQVDDESREVFRRTIDRELATLKRFLDDLRNLVRPQPLERFAMDVNPLIAEIAEAMRPEGERQGVSVEGRCAGNPLTLHGDRFALGRVFRNLITNAIQATAAGGQVTVATRLAGDQVEVSVTDTGSGIPAEQLAHIFDDFVTTKRRGLGLGLAISKRIVEQLDGTIAVDSEVGRGTTFTVRFPERKADHSALAAS